MKIERIGLYVFASIGVVSLVFAVAIILVGNLIFGGNDDPVFQERILSPSEDFQAIRIINSGGGAAGWCQDFIIVQPTNRKLQRTPNYRESQPEIVFSANCDSSFSMEWSSPVQLVIRQYISSDKLNNISIKAKDATGKIIIRFVPEV
jgi:hypothetical protein